MDVKQRALLWGHLLVTLPAVAGVVIVLLFRKYLFVPGWPYYLTIGLAFGYQWYIAAIPRWRMALARRGFSESDIEEIARNGGLVLPGASSAGVFAVHTTAVGLCATYLNFWLVGWFVHWVLPLIGEPAPAHVTDFYVQHFELANVVPAFLLGCVLVRKFPEFTAWAWLVPCAVVLYKLGTFVDANASVLEAGSVWRGFSYYFVIQRIAPTVTFTRTSFDVSGPDPRRFLEQVTVVAPLYCSIAYCMGASLTKTNVWKQLWESLSRDTEPRIIQPDEADVVVVPHDSVEEPLRRE
ncbi:MAG TPA: hypothetical protein VH596_17580 [Terriglobales bacterium]